MSLTDSSRAPMDAVSRICAVGGRLLVLFSALVVLLMPFTEYFWHFDRFPYGGQDFELSVLSLVAILGLIIVLIQHGKRGITYLFGVRQWLSVVRNCEQLRIDCGLQGINVADLATPALGAVPGLSNPPLRI